MSEEDLSKDRLAVAHSHRVSREYLSAIPLYRDVSRQQPDNAESWIGLALCYEELGEQVVARQALLTCLVLHPQAAIAQHRLGWLAYRTRNFGDALRHYTKAAHCVPNWHEPHYHAAVCLHEQRRYAEAIAGYRTALICKPELAPIWYHVGKACKDGGQLDAALPLYRNALSIQAEYADARYSLGLLHLLRGEWFAGWEGYELRWRGSDRAAIEHRPLTTLRLWQGEETSSGCGIVVYAEQGMGDSIMCFRFAGRLLEKFARVKFSVTVPLIRLFQKCAPAGVEVVARIHQAIDESGYTHYINMLSLPAAFKTTSENVPAMPYLHAPLEMAKSWRERFSGESRKKVGLVWKGGSLSHAPARDMAFSNLTPLLELEGFRWISLQKGEAPPRGAPVTDWMDEVGDFADTAALIDNLDLVVAVDTAVAHLAGALGKPVWLYNRFESEWRWMYGQVRSPWYPSMRIFSQSRPGDWEGVTRQIKAAMLDWAEHDNASC